MTAFAGMVSVMHLGGHSDFQVWKSSLGSLPALGWTERLERSISARSGTSGPVNFPYRKSHERFSRST